MICDPLKIAAQAQLRPQTYTVIVERADRVVAKMETAHGPMLFKASTVADDMTWDAINIGRLSAADLPVPTIIAQGEQPVSYIMLRWIEGDALTSASPLAAQHEAGRLLRRVHYLADRPPYARGYTWDAWMTGWLNAALPWWGAQPGIMPQWIDRVWRNFERMRPLLATRGTHFMLQDGRPDHFLVRGERIVGLIDVHDAQPGDSAMDLGVIGIFDNRLLENVRAGYKGDAVEKQTLDQLLPFYIFLRRLAAAEWHAKFGSAVISQKALALTFADRKKNNGDFF